MLETTLLNLLGISKVGSLVPHFAVLPAFSLGDRASSRDFISCFFLGLSVRSWVLIWAPIQYFLACSTGNTLWKPVNLTLFHYRRVLDILEPDEIFYANH